MSPDLAFNTAVSFVTNTNWQAYGGETTLSYFSQMVGLTVQNFLSAATGIAVGAAVIRGFAGRQAKDVGNFWVDLTRSILYVLLPLSIIAALFLVWQGVPQNLAGYVHATTLEGGQQVIAQGPAASQIAIKQLGTNGGGFFNANSAHPYENPTPISNLLGDGFHPAHPCRLLHHVRAHGEGHAPGRCDPRRHVRAVRRRAVAHLWFRDRRQSGAVGAADRPVGGQHGGQGGPLRCRQFRPVGDGDDCCLERLGQRHA